MNITNDKEDAVRRGCILFASRIFLSDVTEKLSACDLHFYYTWADILVELRKQTPVGKSFEQKLNEYYIYQLNRSKK